MRSSASPSPASHWNQVSHGCLRRKSRSPSSITGHSLPLLARLEPDGDLGGYAGTRDKIIHALESAGVIFVEENDEGPGVRLKKGKGAKEMKLDAIAFHEAGHAVVAWREPSQSSECRS